MLRPVTETAPTGAASGTEQTSGRRWAPIVALGAFVAMLTTTAAAKGFDADGWWHLRDGDLILDGGFPRTDPFSWTVPGKSWRLNGWGYDVLAALVRDAGGLVAVSVVSLASIGAFAAACYLLARRAGARPWPAAGAAMASTWVMAPWMAERPQVWSYLLFGAAIVIAERALAGALTPGLVALFLLMVAWSNFHLAFTAGVIVVGLMSVGYALRTRDLVRPGLVVAATVVGGLCNPYGPGAYTAALRVREASQLIVEWRHVSLGDSQDLILLAIAGVTLFTLVRTGRWRRFELSLPIVVFTVMSVDAVRNAPFLALLCAPQLALAFGDWRMERVRAYARARSKVLLPGAFAGLVVLAIMPLVGADGIRPVTPEKYPVRSTAAIPDGCRVLNRYADGGYIIDRRWPAVHVSQDPRNDMYGSETLTAQWSVLRAAPGWQNWLDDHRVDCVLVLRTSTLARELAAIGWRRAATDPRHVLLLRP